MGSVDAGIRGMTLQGGHNAGYLTTVDYDRLKRWNINSVMFESMWDDFENEDGSIIQANLDATRASVDLAKSYGFTPYLGLRITQNAVPAEHWVDALGGAAYANMNLVRGTVQIGGRQRYVNFVRRMSADFNDCGICPWYMPYHADENGQIQEHRTAYYFTTFPAMLSAIRDAGNRKSAVFVPVYQGWLFPPMEPNGNWWNITGAYDFAETTPTGAKELISQSWYNDDNLLWNGYTHDNEMTQCGLFTDAKRANFDYQWQGLRNFINRSNNVKIASVEFNAFSTHSDYYGCNTNGVPESSRLEYFEKVFQYTAELKGSWWYYVYERPPPWWGGPTDDAGNDTVLTDVIKAYATMTPPPTLPFHDSFTTLNPAWQTINGNWKTV